MQCAWLHVVVRNVNRSRGRVLPTVSGSRETWRKATALLPRGSAKGTPQRSAIPYLVAPSASRTPCMNKFVR